MRRWNLLGSPDLVGVEVAPPATQSSLPAFVSPPSSNPAPLSAPENHTQWFATEVHPHGEQLKAWLHGTFPAVRNEVDDVVQESYLRVWRRHTARPIASAKAFLFKAARNIAIDFLRRGKASPFDPLSSLQTSCVIDEAPNAAEKLSLQEKYDLLAEAVATLPARRYEVIILHKFKGLSQKEVAAQLGISERTVANQVLIAVRYCEDYLRARGVTSLLS